jgi:hypothetical protein
MKTLWDKLSEENKKKLEVSKLQFPALFGGLINTLKEQTAWTELKVYDANILLSETIGKEISINNLYDLFDDK